MLDGNEYGSWNCGFPFTRLSLVKVATSLEPTDHPLIALFQYSADRLVKPSVGGYTLTNYVDMRASQDMYLLAH